VGRALKIPIFSLRRDTYLNRKADGVEFFEIVPKVGIVTETTRYSLAEANSALDDLRSGRLKGAAVLVP
jgi:alcohol dehydrogenase, propanol-preferring